MKVMVCDDFLKRKVAYIRVCKEKLGVLIAEGKLEGDIDELLKAYLKRYPFEESEAAKQRW